MGYQATFKRYELKYRISKEEKEKIIQEMTPYMRLDAYGRTTIRNVYFDTENFRLIRHCLEKPVYKEKLRLRSYQRAQPQDQVFVELKKKYQSVVYKRRLAITQAQAVEVFGKNLPIEGPLQIAKEMNYFRFYYQPLRPAVFLSYEREAYYALDGSDFRVTFDENILYRQEDISLASEIYGTPLLKEEALMEIKTSGGIPLWMSHSLSKAKIFHTSFSKYGSAYQHMLLHQQGGLLYA